MGMGIMLVATVDMERMGSLTLIKRRSKIGDATTAEAVETHLCYP